MQQHNAPVSPLEIVGNTLLCEFPEVIDVNSQLTDTQIEGETQVEATLALSDPEPTPGQHLLEMPTEVPAVPAPAPPSPAPSQSSLGSSCSVADPNEQARHVIHEWCDMQ